MKVRRGHKARQARLVRPDLKVKKAIQEPSGWPVQVVRLVPTVQAAASARQARLVHPAHRVLLGLVACTR